MISACEACGVAGAGDLLTLAHCQQNAGVRPNENGRKPKNCFLAEDVHVFACLVWP